MKESLDYMIGFHCAPALMGIKVSNLVSVPRQKGAELDVVLDDYNQQFNARGLFFFELCRCKARRMLFVYRKELLESYLRDHKNMAFLMGQGYKPDMTLEEMLERLRERMEASNQFPHEIGIFLGYPLADVAYFMYHHGDHYEVCGEWKAYTNVSAAQYTFYRFELCRAQYQAQLLNGCTFSSLVA
ncbi:MAG: DUF3793 family protein [Veillonella sp.]|nr:DUF3793 family protein [Veillonella sp.]MCF0156854.1 DUF3793 family protein [Veillonella sp.]